MRFCSPLCGRQQKAAARVAVGHMPRRPRKNATMDQFLTKPAAAGAAVSAAAQGSTAQSAADELNRRSPAAAKLGCAEPAAAAARGAEPLGGTPLKKRPRSSAGTGNLAPQRLLKLQGDGASASAPQPLSSRSAAASKRARDDSLASAATAKREPPPPLTGEQEQLLKDFDLRSRFGAAAGVDRLVRWERAHRLGLNPPAVVREILTEYADVPEARRCVLDGHLQRYDPGGDSGIRS